MDTFSTYQSPVGSLLLCVQGNVLHSLSFGNLPPGQQQSQGPLHLEAARQLDTYFAGKLKQFTLPLAAQGTPFQQAVWAALQTIPYGATVTYGQLAAQIGNPKASRAVGMANNRNPLAIIVPCHRVIGANKKLVGYAGGLHIKEYLLALEAENT